jgi:hypothetical protein
MKVVAFMYYATDEGAFRSWQVLHEPAPSVKKYPSRLALTLFSALVLVSF